MSQAPQVPAPSSARTARHAGLYAIAIAVDTVLWLIVLPFLTRHVSLEVFGQFTLIRVVVPVLLALADLGCGVATVRTLADTVDVATRREIVGTLVAARAVIACGLLVLGGVLGLIVGGTIGRALAVTGLLVAAWTMHGAAVDALRGLGRHLAGAIAIATTGAVGFGAILALTVVAGGGLPGLLGGIAAGYVASAGLGLLVLRRDLGAPRLATYRRLLGFGGPVAVYFGLRTAMALDRYVLGALGGISQAGLFQLASTPTGGIELMEQAGVLAAEPAVYGATAADGPRLLEPIFRIGALLTIGAGLFVGLASPELVRLLGPPEYHAALSAMSLLTLAAVTRALARLIGLGAGATGQTRVWATFQTVEIVLAALLMVALVPRSGVTGAAIAHIVASVVALGVCRALVARVAPAFRFALGRAGIFFFASLAASIVLGSELVRAPAPLAVRAVAFGVLAVLGLVLLGGPLFHRPPARATIER